MKQASKRALACALTVALLTGPASAARAEPAGDSIDTVRLVDISVGYSHSLAIDENGEVWVWGDNTYGQWGEDTYDLWWWDIPMEGDFYPPNYNVAHTPAKVPGLGDIVQVSAGDCASYALQSDGTVWSWGRNLRGKQLGDSTEDSRTEPARVPGLNDVVQVMASTKGNHCVALKADGTVWSWGENSCGQLGDGTTDDSALPVRALIDDVAEISVGSYFTMALRADGAVWIWGLGSWGRMGDGSLDGNNPIPRPVPGLGDIAAVSAGLSHCMALGADGAVWFWGSDGTSYKTSDYALRPTLYSVTQTDAVGIRAGHGQSLVLRADGSVYGWGRNDYGQFGSPSIPDRQLTPVLLEHFSGLTHFFQADAYCTVFSRADGSVWGYGYNYYGQLRPDLTESHSQIHEPVLLFGPGAYIGPGSAAYTDQAQLAGTR